MLTPFFTTPRFPSPHTSWCSLAYEPLHDPLGTSEKICSPLGTRLQPIDPHNLAAFANFNPTEPTHTSSSPTSTLPQTIFTPNSVVFLSLVLEKKTTNFLFAMRLDQLMLWSSGVQHRLVRVWVPTFRTNTFSVPWRQRHCIPRNAGTLLGLPDYNVRPGPMNIWHACPKWHTAFSGLNFVYFFARPASFCE